MNLDADWVIFVDREVVDEHLALRGDGGKDSAGVGSPCYVTNRSIHIKSKKRFPNMRYYQYIR